LEQQHRKVFLSDEQSNALDALKDELIPMDSYNIHQRVTGMFEKIAKSKDAAGAVCSYASIISAIFYPLHFLFLPFLIHAHFVLCELP
jgi:hypothetical protein